MLVTPCFAAIKCLFFLQIVGVNAFSRQINYLCETFRRTVDALRAAAPEMENNVREASALTHELTVLRQDYEAGRLTGEQYATAASRVEADLARLSAIEQRVSSTFQVVLAAVDPAGLQEVLGQLYASLASCVAAASSKYFRLCSIGFSIGHVISDRLAVVMRARRERLQRALKQTTCVSMSVMTSTVDCAVTPTRPDRERATTSATINAVGKEATVTLLRMIEDSDWITPTAHCVGNVVGWCIAYYLQTLASAISACSLGSEMIISSVQSIMDPICVRYNLPSVRSEQYTEVTALAQSTLIGFGITRIIYARGLFGSSHLSGIAGFLLLPLTISEKFINGAFATLGIQNH